MEDTTQKHICGQCSDEWLTEAEYLGHTCPSTGFTPASPEHLGPEFAAVQKAALERGMEHVAGDPEAEARQMEAINSVDA